MEAAQRLISVKDLIEMLRTTDPDKNRLATATLIQAGRPILSRLVAHAADPAKGKMHRVRIVKVVEGIGYPTNPFDRLILFHMVTTGPPSVRRAVAKMVKHLRFDVPEHGEEGAIPAPPQLYAPGFADGLSGHGGDATFQPQEAP